MAAGLLREIEAVNNGCDDSQHNRNDPVLHWTKIENWPLDFFQAFAFHSTHLSSFWSVDDQSGCGFSAITFRSASTSSPILYFFISSRASVEWPTSSKASVASFPACSSRTSSPPGCCNQIENYETFVHLPYMSYHSVIALMSSLYLLSIKWENWVRGDKILLFEIITIRIWA